MKAKVYFAAVVCLVSVVARAQDDTNQAAATKILAMESIWNQAEEHGDIKALDLIFDNALIYVDEDGSMLTKAQFLLRARSQGSQPESLVTQTTSVHVYGETALVVGNYRVKGVIGGKPYKREGRFIDTWVLKKGTWICVAAQATPVQ